MRARVRVGGFGSCGHGSILALRAPLQARAFSRVQRVSLCRVSKSVRRWEIGGVQSTDTLRVTGQQRWAISGADAPPMSPRLPHTDAPKPAAHGLPVAAAIAGHTQTSAHVKRGRMGRIRARYPELPSKSNCSTRTAISCACSVPYGAMSQERGHRDDARVHSTCCGIKGLLTAHGAQAPHAHRRRGSRVLSECAHATAAAEGRSILFRCALARSGLRHRGVCVEPEVPQNIYMGGLCHARTVLRTRRASGRSRRRGSSREG